MTEIIPVLNMIEKLNPPRKGKKRSKRMAKKKSYAAAARKAGAVYKSGSKKGRIMSVAAAKLRGIRIPGYTSKKASKKKSSSKKRKKTPLAVKYRSKRKKAGKRPYTRTGYKKGRRMTWAEAAHHSGAVYPKKYPAGHPKAGKKHPKAGRAMTKEDALKYQRPVVGYLSRDMIKGFYDQVLTPGGRLTKSKKKINKAYQWLSEWNDALANLRKRRGSAWLRAPQSYKRSGKTKKGRKYEKGDRRPDYRVYWSDDPAAWQSGAGQHLRVKFRKGRGPVSRIPVVRGIGPSEKLVAELETGGFGGPLDAPGGTVKLNRGRKRKTSRRRKARRKNPARTSKGRFKKKKRSSNRRRRRRKKKAKAWNPKRRRRRKKKKTTSKRRRSRRRKSGASNPKRRRKRRSSKRPRYRRKKSYAKNPRKRRRKNKGYAKNPFKAQLSQIQSRAFWLTVAHVGVGITGTALISSQVMKLGPVRRIALSPGLAGKFGRFAICLGSAGLLSAGAYMLRKVKLVGQRGWVNVLVGGTVYCTANLLAELIGGAGLIPAIGVPAAGGNMSGLGSYYDPELPYGSYPGQYPGMGAVMSPEDLVAGESLARNVNEFSGMSDWMELSGLGSSGGTPVPLEDLRGYPGQYGGGMNDWVEFQPSSGLVQAGFNPGAEAF